MTVILVAGLAFLVTGFITYFSGYLSLFGVAVSAGSAAALAGILTALAEGHHRSVGVWLAAVATLAGSVAPFVLMRKAGPPGVAELVGGCEPFVVVAQNRWEPIGVMARAQPLLSGKEVARYLGNTHLTVDGWVRTRAPYPENPSPWDSDVWFHLSDSSGWISFAGVRADPTPYDPTGLDPNGGRPAPTPAECSGTVRW